MTADEKLSKKMEQVRALLAKADSTTFPAEADAFRAKADELMAQYAIEQWQLDAHRTAQGARPDPVSRQYDMVWYRDNARKDELWSMMQAVATHCRCTIAYWKYNGEIPIVGLPSDIDYFDMLFTHLMLQMGKNLEPHPEAGKSMIENLVVMKEAGMKWERIGELLIRAGQLDHYDRNVGVKFTKLYTDYCDENDRPRLRVSPSVYQRSYAKGFVATIKLRLRDQRESRGSGMELALVDIEKKVAEAACDIHGRPNDSRVVRYTEGKVDRAAWSAGSEDGRKASLSANPNETVRRGSTAELSS